jgi:transposase-like protein
MSQPKYRVPPEVKQQILEKVKEGKIPVPQIAEEHGIRPQAIYAWLGHGARRPSVELENLKLPRENQQLMEIIGKLTVELSVEKKKQHGAGVP